MATLESLPRELLHRIFSYLDQKARKELGLASQLLQAIGKEWVFRALRLSPADGTSEVKLENILASVELTQCVKKIYIDLYAWSAAKRPDEDEDPEDFVLDWFELPLEFQQLFDRLQDFPRLQDVALLFHHDCVGEAEGDPDDSDFEGGEAPQPRVFRSSVMEAFMEKLVSLPRLPRELAILNLENINETDPNVVANITTVLRSLRSLRLNIMHQHHDMGAEYLDVKSPEPHVFFAELPSFWLKPALVNLQHLSLFSSVYFGFYPKLDLSDVHFPQLKSLALGRYTFAHDSQLEWILSHGATLIELYLDYCSIIWEVAISDPENTLLDPSLFVARDDLFAPGLKWMSYATRWCDYFRAFQTGLPLLRQFRCGTSLSWWDYASSPFELETTLWPHLHQGCYTTYCDWKHDTQYMAGMVRKYTAADGTTYCKEGEGGVFASEEDEKALVELCAKIGQVVDDSYGPLRVF